MPATDLILNMELTGSGTLSKATDLSTAEDNVAIGRGSFDALTLSLVFGTSSGQAKEWFHDERTLANGAGDSLDLAGGLTSPLGDTITFTTIKMILVAVDAPDGTKAVRVGPQGVASTFVGPFGDASDYITVTHWALVVNEPVAGYTVTAGSGDLLRIANQSGVSVTYRVWVVGETA